MKKTLLFSTAVAFTMLIAIPKAQAQWDGKGTKTVDVGVGVGSSLGVGGGLPVRASFQMGINDNISVGGYFGYVSTESFNIKYNYTVLGARGEYHHPLIDGFDTYGGLLISYNLVGWDSNIGIKPVNFIGYSFFIGGRKMFTDKIGAFAELGYGISWLQAGLTIKL